MALVPYTATALAESDSEGTSGKNIVEFATVTLFDLDDNPITMYDNAAGSNGQTSKLTNTSGFVIFWVEPGTYKLIVNATLAIIEIAEDSTTYGIGVESGILWPNAADLTDFTGVFPWVNYSLDLSAPYTGTGLPSTLDGLDINAALVYEGDLNGFGNLRLTDAATGNVWIKTFNNGITQVDWQVSNATPATALYNQAFASRNSMFSWWVGPKTVRYTDDTYNRTYQSFCDKDGLAGVLIHDHKAGTTDKYILNTELTPDDHNAGCIGIGSGKVVVVVGGRSNTVQPVDQCFLAEWDIDDKPFGSSYTTYFVDVGRDYPNLYQYENDAILLASQRGGTGGETTGHSFVTNSWPLGSGAGSWSSKVDLTDQLSVPDWMYLVTRRDTANPNIIHMAWGFHPTNVADANIYKSEIRHVGGANPWRLYANGVEIANMSTGSGLPIDLTDLELVYTAGANERTRLYDVKDDQIVFTKYINTGDPIPDKLAAEYWYIIKSGTWNAYKIADSGQAFLTGGSTYFPGVTIAENGNLFCGRNISGFYQFSEYVTINGGVTWQEQGVIRFSNDNDNGTNAVHGRSNAEVPSLSTIERGDVVDLQVVGWCGRYDRDSFSRFYTSLISLNPQKTDYTLNPSEYQALTIATEDCDTHGEDCVVLATRNGDITGVEYQLIAASEDSVISDTQRQAIIADSGSTVRSRNTFFGGTRNSTASGFINVDGTPDNWIMGAIGAEDSTISKTYSFFGGVTNCTTGTPNSINIKCNAGLAAEDIIVDGQSDYVFFAAAFDSDIDGDFSGLVGVSGCSIAQGNPSNFGASMIAASIDCTNTTSRSYQIGSTGCFAQATGAGMLSSESSVSNANSALIVSSFNCQQNNTYTLSGGVNFVGGPSTANRKWQVSSSTGNLLIAGTLTQSHAFADTAKMIKNGEGVEIEAGYLLILIGDKVYKSKAGENVDAIVAATPSVIHNDTPFAWQGRNVLDDFGRVVTQSVLYVRWDMYEGPKSLAINIPEDAEEYLYDEPVENPDYNPDAENISRSERPNEWTIAGVHGVIRTRVDATVTQQIVDALALQRQNAFIEPSLIDGIGTISQDETNVQVMSVEKEYNGEYAVALCYFKGS